MKLDLTGQRFATKVFTRGGAIGGPPSSADVHTMSHIELSRSRNTTSNYLPTGELKQSWHIHVGGTLARPGAVARTWAAST